MPKAFETRSIGLSAALLLTAGLHAQLAEWTDARTCDVRLNSALPMPGGAWVTLGQTQLAGSSAITKWSSTGEQLWTAVDNHYLDGQMGSAVTLPDGGMLSAGLLDGCDVIMPWSSVKRYSADGEVLWDTVFIAEYRPPCIAAKGSTTLLAIAGDSTVLMDLDGAVLAGWPSIAGGSSAPHLLHWLGDTALVQVFADQTRVVDLNGAVLASTANTASPIDVLVTSAGEVALLAAGQLHLLTPLLQTTVIIPNTTSSNARSVHQADGALYVSTETGLLQRAGNALEPVFDWPPLPAVLNANACVRDGQVLLVGYSQVGGFTNGVARSLSLTGAAAQHNNDVEVLLSVDSAWAEYAWGSFYRQKAQLRIHVVNQGPLPLNRVAVSARTGAIWIDCVNPNLYVVRDDLELAPGDTALVWAGVHLVNLASLAWTGAQLVEVCVVAQSPNATVDRQPADNRSCAFVPFTVGVPEQAGTAALRLAPNPATDHCLLSGLEQFGARPRFEIRDAAGRLVESGQLSTTDGVSPLATGHLPSGAYHLVVSSARGRASVQLVICAP